MSLMLPNYQLLYVTFYSLFLFSCFALATPTSWTRYSLHAEQRRDLANPENTCGFEGDSDTYGLGIRLGLYIQWLTNAITYGFLPAEIRSIRALSNCFQGAMLIGLIFITTSLGSDLYAVEAYIVLTFCFAGSFVEGMISDVTAFEFEETKKLEDQVVKYAVALGGIIQFFLGVALYGYGVWFFFTGMDDMKHPPCSTFVFFFARLDLYGKIRTFMKVLFLLSLISQAVMLGTAIIWKFKKSPTSTTPDAASPNEPEELGREIVNRGEAEGEGVNLMEGTAVEKGNAMKTEEAMKDEGEKEKTMNLGDGLSGVLSSAFLRVTTVIAVELMIKWNHIEGLYSLWSTGQLLPLLIAAGGLSTVLYKAYIAMKKAAVDKDVNK